MQKRLPHFIIHHTPNPKRRHNAANPRSRTGKPPRPNQQPALSPRHICSCCSCSCSSYSAGAWTVVQVQPQQVHRRGQKLDSSRGSKLRSRQARHATCARVRIQIRRQSGRDVKRGEYRERVSERKERVARQRDGSRRAGRHGAKELHKRLVLVHAQRDVCCRRRGELGGAGGCGVRGTVGEGRGEGVDCVGG